MVGFLRKKNKDAPVKPVPSGPIPLAGPVSPPPAVAPVAPLPPLFARFSTSSTSKSTNGTQATPRIVSSPMVLSSNARKDHHGHGQAEAVKKRSTQHQGPNRTLQSVTPSAPIVDKALPPPTPPTSSSDPSGSPPSSLAIKQTRAPSAFQNQRILLDDVEETGPSSFQPFYSAQSSSTSLVSSPASRRSSNALTSPSKRNPAVLSNTNLAPQILPPIANRKLPEQQNPPAPAFGRQNLSTPAAQTQTPHLSQSSSVANQDLQPAIVNPNMSMTGASSSQMGMQQIDTERSSVSDRNSLDIDLPPEFTSLFHNFYRQFDLEDRNSVSSTPIPNSNGHVPASNVPPSSITPRSSISISSPSRESLLSSRPRQPPLPEAHSDMGVASSHAIGNGLLPSSMKDFYPPRVNGRASPFNNNNAAANQPQMHNRRHSRPLPSPPLLNQDVSASFSPRSEVPSNRTLQRDPNFQSSGSSPPKSTHSQNPSTVPMTGKPRIFAARSPPVDELDRESASFSKPPPQHVQSSAKKQSTRHVQQPQQPQHQPERSAYTNGSDSFKPSPQPATPKISNHSVEQLPPTPPSQTRRSSRLSRTGSKPDAKRPRSHHIPPTPIRKTDEENLQSRHVPPMPGSHSRKGSNSEQHAPRSSSQSRKDPRSDEQRSHSRTKSSKSDEQRLQSQHGSSPGSRSRKSSKPRGDVDIVLPSTPDSHHHRPSSVRTSMKSRPSTPVTIPHPPLPSPRPTPLEPAFQLDADTNSKAGIPLDDDRFSREEGVTLMKEDKESVNESNEKTSKESKVGSEKVSAVVVEGVAPPTPISPEEHKTKKKKKKRRDNDDQSELTLVSVVADDSDSAITAAEEPEPIHESESEPEPEPILPLCTIVDFVSDPQHLSSLLTFLSFYDWCVLSSLSKEIRKLLVETPELREPVLERYLMTVGYSRWRWDDPDPLSLSLQDLNDYMRGVSTPTHEYARVAGMYAHSLTMHPKDRDPTLIDVVRILTMSTRAYSRVILRLRAQAEKEATLAQQSRGLGMTIKQPNFHLASSPVRGAHSRAPSPTTSNYSYSHNGAVMQESALNLTFRSPLFRLRRAPLLRVFVPSPEGDWLSDKSVLGCEEECRRAGVMHLMRFGDVVWDVAVGDEGNVGRMVWDGSYLIDLDYTYTSIGDLPKYMPALAFPPSYFHRVIRTGPVISNPIVHIDISPWGEELAMNLQLLQDRVRTETPQGAYHNVVRWVHRSSFVIRPGHARYMNPQGGRPQMIVPRIAIPDTDNLFVDSGWHGTVVVETDGTNEALGDLQERCGPGAFPARFRARSVHPQISQIQIENKKVFRILREKSRPGEIWIKSVGVKERIM